MFINNIFTEETKVKIETTIDKSNSSWLGDDYSDLVLVATKEVVDEDDKNLGRFWVEGVLLGLIAPIGIAANFFAIYVFGKPMNTWNRSSYGTTQKTNIFYK